MVKIIFGKLLALRQLILSFFLFLGRKKNASEKKNSAVETSAAQFVVSSHINSF